MVRAYAYTQKIPVRSCNGRIQRRGSDEIVWTVDKQVGNNQEMPSQKMDARVGSLAPKAF